MLTREVKEGALYYGQNKRRQNILFDAELRQITTDTAHRLHALLNSNLTPPPEYAKKCESCSFISQCLPKIAGKKKVANYLNKIEVE